MENLQDFPYLKVGSQHFPPGLPTLLAVAFSSIYLNTKIVWWLSKTHYHILKSKRRAAQNRTDNILVQAEQFSIETNPRCDLNFNLTSNIAHVDFRACKPALLVYYYNGRWLVFLLKPISPSSLLFYQFRNKIAPAIKGWGKNFN